MLTSNLLILLYARLDYIDVDEGPGTTELDNRRIKLLKTDSLTLAGVSRPSMRNSFVVSHDINNSEKSTYPQRLDSRLLYPSIFKTGFLIPQTMKTEQITPQWFW